MSRHHTALPPQGHTGESVQPQNQNAKHCQRTIGLFCSKGDGLLMARLGQVGRSLSYTLPSTRLALIFSVLHIFSSAIYIKGCITAILFYAFSSMWKEQGGGDKSGSSKPKSVLYPHVPSLHHHLHMSTHTQKRTGKSDKSHK